MVERFYVDRNIREDGRKVYYVTNGVLRLKACDRDRALRAACGFNDAIDVAYGNYERMPHRQPGHDALYEDDDF